MWMCVTFIMALKFGNLLYVWNIRVLSFARNLCLWSVAQAETLITLAFMSMAFKQTFLRGFDDIQTYNFFSMQLFKCLCSPKSLFVHLQLELMKYCGFVTFCMPLNSGGILGVWNLKVFSFARNLCLWSATQT